MADLFQTNLFPDDNNRTAKISGLQYIQDFISKSQEDELLQQIDSKFWLTDLKRRVQHYGWKYDYSARKIDASMKLGDIPDWLKYYCLELYNKKLFSETPDQVIVNEYEAGQGISSHIDSVPCFAENIASISLGSPCVMDFVNNKTNEKISHLLHPRSAVILSGDVRYLWKHGIAARKTDKIDGNIIKRGRRVSLTFRRVII